MCFAVFGGGPLLLLQRRKARQILMSVQARSQRYFFAAWTACDPAHQTGYRRSEAGQLRSLRGSACLLFPVCAVSVFSFFDRFIGLSADSKSTGPDHRLVSRGYARGSIKPG